jgi:N-acetylmuramoyl-L-alanine amidase
VRLEDWARLNQFQIRWLDREKILQLSNRLTRITLVVNSSDAQINGVQVRLSFPVALRNGTVELSQLDLGKTFDPVLYPPANKPGIKIKTICLDPGHGGNDMGEHVGGIQEKKYTLLLSQELSSQLTRAGFNVVMTRTKDTKPELSDRTEIARRRKADLFICVHFNSSPVDLNEVKGIETYCLTPAGATSSNAQGEGDTRWFKANGNDEKNMLLAYLLQKSMVRELPVEDRGVKRARFQVLREATMPAVLIEGGFLSHPIEQKKILDAAYRRQLARAIVDGILAYKKTVRG